MVKQRLKIANQGKTTQDNEMCYNLKANNINQANNVWITRSGVETQDTVWHNK